MELGGRIRQAGKQGLASGAWPRWAHSVRCLKISNTGQTPLHVDRTFTCLSSSLPNLLPTAHLPPEAEFGGPSWAQFFSKQQVLALPTCISWLSPPDHPHSFNFQTEPRPQDGPGVTVQGARVGVSGRGALRVGDEGKHWRLHLLPFPPPPPPPLPLPPSPALCSSSALSQSQAVRPGWLVGSIQAPS